MTRLRPSGRGADVWDRLHPTGAQQRELYEWLLAHGEDVLTGDSFFHLGGYGAPLPGLNLCGAGRVVCLIDPIGDVYACPFVIHDEFLSPATCASRVDSRGVAGVRAVHRPAPAAARRRVRELRLFDKCRGGCMAAKFFTGLPLAGPDPECVLGHGERAARRARCRTLPQPAVDHSRGAPRPSRPDMR